MAEEVAEKLCGAMFVVVNLQTERDLCESAEGEAPERAGPALRAICCQFALQTFASKLVKTPIVRKHHKADIFLQRLLHF